MGKYRLTGASWRLILGKIVICMAESKTKNTESSRSRLLAMAREQYPDRNFADLEGGEAQGDVDSLDDAIDEILQGYITKQKTYDENNSKLRDLLLSDPESAEVVQAWVETGDPREALVRVFGDEYGISDEGREKFKDDLAAWRKRREENDALNAEAEKNWQDSLNALVEWGNGKGLSAEQQRDVMLRLLSITFNGMANKYGPEDFDLAINAINHDADVAVARREGEVAGRNAKIKSEYRDRSVASAMPPASRSGQGGKVLEKTPSPEDDNPWSRIK